MIQKARVETSNLSLNLLTFFSSNIFNNDGATQFFWVHPFQIRQVNNFNLLKKSTTKIYVLLAKNQKNKL